MQEKIIDQFGGKDKAGIMQVDNMIRWLLDREWIKKEYGDEFGMYWSAFWDAEKSEAKITVAQKKYINALIMSDDRPRLRAILDQYVHYH